VIPPAWRARLLALTESPLFQRTIVVLIVVNAAILGLETSPSVMTTVGETLLALDRAILAVFVVELLLRIGAHGRSFFRDPWSLFDTFVVGIALVPSSEGFAVLRALRVLRVLRIASAVPRMRRVVEALPRTGAEDFAYFAREVPGFYFWLGIRPPGTRVEDAAPNHSPLFRVDEDALELGVRALANVAVDWLAAN